MTTKTSTPVATAPQTVTLTKTEPKVNSVRFDAPLDPTPAVRTVYLSNEAHAALGSPDSITIVITAA